MTHAIWPHLSALIISCWVFGCGSPPDIRSPQPETPLPPARTRALWGEVQNVFESRCVVCHGCYDAPCQLKLGSYEGIDRGASPDLIYDSTRLLAAKPTRLGIDAHGRAGWREKHFHPVLAEGVTAEARQSLLMRMLDLKRKHPLTSGTDIATSFTLTLDRKQTCTKSENFDDFAKAHPLWGMPYALPGISAEEEQIISDWVRAGAPNHEPSALDPATERAVAAWEAYLNGDSLEAQLVARYIYEHLFLTTVRFEETAIQGEAPLFRLLRSRTLHGAIDEIATRRPFDDPQVSRVYYRFERRRERPLEKTLMPYPLGAERLRHWQKLFASSGYAVKALPSYDARTSANPFRAFRALPLEARYRFLLEEARSTLMGFIKGPVCRGQVALDVIEDRFWVFFVAPDSPWQKNAADLLAQTKADLDLPAEAGSTALPTAWFRFGDDHADYVEKKADWLDRATRDGKDLTRSVVWNGDGRDDNAALTVFRHFDSATVEKGLIGGPPKTAWVLDYPLLEQIHYLLFAGFDVYGNVVHQLSTRLYMDYLRMGGETGFLAVLPPERRRELALAWYRGVTGKAQQRVIHDLMGKIETPAIGYKTPQPELEAFDWLRDRLAPVLSHGFDAERVEGGALRAALDQLSSVRGVAANLMPELAFVAVSRRQGAPKYFTIVRDSAHTNVAHLFHEDARRRPQEDALLAIPGFLGAYPNALFQVKEVDLPAFGEQVGKLDGPADYRALRTRFGVLRASPDFWKFSDELNAAHRKSNPREHGTFDYNRLEAY